MDLIREALALVFALAVAAMIDRQAVRRGLDPPGFQDPARRMVVGLGLAFVLFLGVFYPAMFFDREVEVDFEALNPIQLFASQLLLLGWLALWWTLGSARQPAVRVPRQNKDPEQDGEDVEDHDRQNPRPQSRSLARSLGLRWRGIGRELWIGLGAGLVGWFGVLSAALLLSLLVVGVGGERLLNREPAEQIVWLASLPIGLRLAVSLAAGIAEELFFRGFLQPRIGIAASSLLFIGAHLAYGEPFMLFGITLLSLFYAGLVVWRGSVWAAMAAHFLFDAVQLLLIIPQVLKLQEL